MIHAMLHLTNGDRLLMMFEDRTEDAVAEGIGRAHRGFHSYVAGCLARGDTITVDADKAFLIRESETESLGCPGRDGRADLHIPAARVLFVDWEFDTKE